ncbi:MAG: hypothetical protein KAT70_06485, partial [Thermoplasmata archaeon]|nr:hypothetical protein [Thermoplasmata archaeon]
LLAPAPSEGGDRVGSGLADALGVAATNQNLDHCADGLSKLLAVFTDKPRLDALICSFLDQTQDLETALWALFTERTLDASVGVQLDGLGAIVGEPRKARTDDVYRQSIRVRVLVNRSNGQVEELYTIVISALGSATEVRIRDRYPAALDVNVDSSLGFITPEDLLSILLESKGAGISLTLIYTYSDENSTFTFDTQPPGSDLSLGFGSTTNATWGGDLASVLA